MSPDAADHRRPEIIRAVHGVTHDGHWFLLADLVGNQPGDSSRAHATRVSRTLGQDSNTPPPSVGVEVRPSLGVEVGSSVGVEVLPSVDVRVPSGMLGLPRQALRVLAVSLRWCLVR